MVIDISLNSKIVTLPNFVIVFITIDRVVKCKNCTDDVKFQETSIRGSQAPNIHECNFGQCNQVCCYVNIAVIYIQSGLCRKVGIVIDDDWKGSKTDAGMLTDPMTNVTAEYGIKISSMILN